MRVNIRAILADPAQRRKLMVSTCIAIQAREGIDTTQAQMEAAYDAVQAERGRHRIRHFPLNTRCDILNSGRG